MDDRFDAVEGFQSLPEKPRDPVMPEVPPDDDPPPVPPVRPGNDECCHSACDPCIFDLYEDALDRYRADLRAWQERRRSRGKDNGRSGCDGRK